MPIQGPSGKPFVPPINPKEIKQETPAEKTTSSTQTPMPAIGQGPEYDAASVAQRGKVIAGMLAQLAIEAEQKNLSFIDILDRIMKLTGMTNPEAALEEANRKLQQEIDGELDSIKSNRELMEEAESWQAFAELLESQLSDDQIESFIGLLRSEIKSIGAAI
ncbi:MAG: hypothetical protein WC901_08100 [Candidatus Margulisiibacteriota bacterium]